MKRVLDRLWIKAAEIFKEWLMNAMFLKVMIEEASLVEYLGL